MDTTIVEAEAPHRIVEHGRGGRVNRIPTTTRLGADRGPRLADHGPRLPLDRALQPDRPGARAARRRLDLARAALARGAAPAARPARVRAPGRERRSPSPGATATRPASLNRLSPPMPRRRRLLLPLLAALAARPASALGVSACGYSSDSKDVVEGEPVKLGDAQLQRHLLALPQPQRQRGLRLPGRPAAAARGLDLLRRLLRSPERKRRSRRRCPTSFDDHRRRQHRPTKRSPAKASTPSRSAAKSNPQEQIPVLDSTPQQGPIEGSLVLFQLPASASENRPLTLSIPGPKGPPKSHSTSNPAAGLEAGRETAPQPARRLRRRRRRLRSRPPIASLGFRPGRRRRTRRP